MKEENFKIYWEMLERYKFVESHGETYRIHPSFQAVFQSHLLAQRSVVEAISRSVIAYEPTASDIEKATICHFIQMYIQNYLPGLAAALSAEMLTDKIMNQPVNEHPLKTLDEVVEAIKKDRDSV